MKIQSLGDRGLIFRMAAFAALSLCLGRAAAQPAEAPGQPTTLAAAPVAADAGPAPQSIEEVVVTATKREAALRDIPLSIDAFSGEQLRQIGANDLDSLLRFSPGVLVNPGIDPESAQITIRGVSTDTFFTFFTRTFGLFYEDVSLVNPSILGPQPNLDPYDMKQVEVLKGPQGTLFGGSALAGAIRYLPNQPDARAAYGGFGSAFGTLARSDGLSHRYEAFWNQPLGEDLAVRVAASRVDHPGYIKNLRSGQPDINSSNATQARAMVNWRATDTLEFRLSGLFRQTRQHDGSFANNDERPEDSQRYYPDRLKSITTALVLNVEQKFDFASVVLVLSRLDKHYPQDIDYSTFFGTSLVGIGTFGNTTVRSYQPSVELRLVSARPTDIGFWPLDNWSYVLGYYFTYADQFLRLDIGTQVNGATLRLQGDVDAREHAGFFDFTRSFGGLELGLGGRIFRQTTSANGGTSLIALEGLTAANPLTALAAPLVQALPASGEVPISPFVGKVGSTVFNPKYTVQYHFSESFSVFGSAIKGFRYAGVNENPSQDPRVPLFFKSDTLWNYEVGVRTRWLGGRLQIDATGFQIDWKNLQIQQNDYTGAFAYITNVGKARNRGAELSVDALLPVGFALKLTGSYIDARTRTFFKDFEGPAPAGSELPGTSPFSGSALLAWTRPLGATETSATVSYTYQDSNYNNLPHTYKHPPLGLLGASASLRLPRVPGAPTLSLVGTNLTNVFKPAVVFDTPHSGGILVIFNQPRSITLGIDFSFGES